MSLPQSSEQSKPNGNQTCCAVLTGPGRSAIGVIGLQGVQAAKIVRQCFQPHANRPLIAGQIRYGNWLGDDLNVTSESVVVTPMQADQFEIHCHGGTAAIARILGNLRAKGAVEVDSFAWANRKPLLSQEAQQVLVGCLTARTAAIAMDQVRGALFDWARHWLDILENEPRSVSGRVSSASEQQKTEVSAGGKPVDLRPSAHDLDQLRDEAAKISSFAPIGLRLTEPFSVVLAGPPNVGKSTLMNQIVGYNRSITNEQAGTTRDVLHADTVIDGLPIRLSDTAGLRESNEAIEREGISRATAAAKAADLILNVNAPSSPLASNLPKEGETESYRRATPSERSPRELSIFNKVDLLPPAQAQPIGSIATNALTGEGIPALLDAIAENLCRNFPSPGEPVPVTERQAEIVTVLATAPTDHAARETLSKLLAEPTDR